MYIKLIEYNEDKRYYTYTDTRKIHNINKSFEKD